MARLESAMKDEINDVRWSMQRAEAEKAAAKGTKKRPSSTFKARNDIETCK